MQKRHYGGEAIHERPVRVALRNTRLIPRQAGLRADECGRQDPVPPPSRVPMDTVACWQHLYSITVAGAAPALDPSGSAPASRFIPGHGHVRKHLMRYKAKRYWAISRSSRNRNDLYSWQIDCLDFWHVIGPGNPAPPAHRAKAARCERYHFPSPTDAWTWAQYSPDSRSTQRSRLASSRSQAPGRSHAPSRNHSTALEYAIR